MLYLKLAVILVVVRRLGGLNASSVALVAQNDPEVLPTNCQNDPRFQPRSQDPKLQLNNVKRVVAICSCLAFLLRSNVHFW